LPVPLLPTLKKECQKNTANYSRMKTLLISCLLLIITIFSYAQTGTIKGSVTDSKTQESLIGTTVLIKGTTQGTITDFDGNFTLPEVEPGTHTLVVSFISYESQEMAVEVKPGEEITLNIALEPATLDIGEVQVVAKANRESEAMLLLDQKNAAGITESIGSSRLSSLGVSDAATATSKITGVTKTESSGDIYIRGLGDRYLTTTMNGLPIPSDDVEKKNIDLNLFSTDIIKNVGIDKTFATSNYGDQASGTVNINSKSYSETIAVGVSGKSSTNVLKSDVWNSFRTTQNMEDVDFGFYDQPLSTEEAITGQSWNTGSRNLPVGFDFSLTGGKQFQLFNNEMSVFATVEHENSYDHYTGVYRKYRSNVLDNSFTDAETFSSNINTTGLLNVAYNFDDYNNLNFNSLIILKTADQLYEQGRNGEGYVFDQDPQETGAFVRDQNLKETRIYINQLLGTHRISENNQLNWGAGYNFVNSDEPNRIRNEVNILNENTVQFAHVGDFQQRKSMQSIEDGEVNGYLKNEHTIKDEDQKKFKLNYGANFRMKQRDFQSLFIGVRAKGVQANSIDNLDQALLNESLYASNDLIIRDRKPDLYNANLNVYAGFVNAGFTFGKFSGNVGARYEMDNIEVNWDVANYVGRIGSVEYDYSNILPGLNFKFLLTEKSSLRLAASKTITLPEFKELAPFEYVSPTGRVTKGNPELKKSENYNLDLKWEFFPTNKELFSATAFYKQINDPINLAQTRGSSGNFIFENTGDKADVYGFELETRFDIIKAETTGKPELNLTLNATKMWFSQDLLEEFQYNNKTETGLQGASDLIANGILSFSNNKENEFAATISGNYSSDKILALGAPEDFQNSATLFNNEIIEKGFVTLDFILLKKISETISLKFTGKNLLNPEIKQTQDIKPFTGEPFTSTVSSYKKGMELILGVKISLN
jgi:outer membrane receptor protein involved in Fe transport